MWVGSAGRHLRTTREPAALWCRSSVCPNLNQGERTWIHVTITAAKMTPVKGMAAAMLPQPSRKACVIQLAPDLPICNRTDARKFHKTLSAVRHGTGSCRQDILHPLCAAETLLQLTPAAPGKQAVLCPVLAAVHAHLAADQVHCCLALLLLVCVHLYVDHLLGRVKQGVLGSTRKHLHGNKGSGSTAQHSTTRHSTMSTALLLAVKRDPSF